MKYLPYLLFALILSLSAHAGLVGVISTPSDDGLISGGKSWDASKEGITVQWQVSQNTDFTWHYRYSFANEDGLPLSMDASHFIINVSDNLTYDDIFNFSGDVDTFELGNFGPDAGNPGFPAGQSIYGLKINLTGQQTFVEFDSTHSPMWGDIYVKGGGNPKNFAYNSDFGFTTANLHDYFGTAVDASGNPLFKVLVLNSVPEPATLTILVIGVFFLKKSSRK